MGEIISASRRTDIPAFFWREFTEMLDKGEAISVNPFSGVRKKVSLLKEDVDCVVFWTKDPAPALKDLENLEKRGIRSVFHITVNCFGPEVETSVPPLKHVAKSVRELSKILGQERVFWRFDPLLPWEVPMKTEYRFRKVADLISEHVSRCYIAVFQPYKKAMIRMKLRDKRTPLEPQEGVPQTLLTLAEEYRIPLYSCCSPPLEKAGIPKGACIDGDYLAKIFSDDNIRKKKNPTRPGCLCTDSRDIGFYRTCRHGCLYCYAR